MSELPTLFITNTETKSVTFTPELMAVVPDMQNAHNQANQAFEADPDARIEKMGVGQFYFRSSHNGHVRASVEVPDGSGKLDEALVTFAPFADRSPASSAEDMQDYLSGSRHNWLVKEFSAQPHTWGQATKSAVTHDLLNELGHGMPVVTIYSPIPALAYSYGERKQQRHGDFSPAARMAMEALKQVQDRIHGSSGTTKIDTLHIDGASLGASNAIGAARSMKDSYNIKTVTAKELILGIDSVAQLANRFMFKTIVGEPSRVESQTNDSQVPESALREAVDAYGSEPIGMIGRSLKAMTKRTYMSGLTKSQPTVEALQVLSDDSVSILIARAANSAISESTAGQLPDGVQLTEVQAEQGQQLGHIMNEFAALSASITGYHIAKSRR